MQALIQLSLATYRVRYRPWVRLVATFGVQGRENVPTLTPAQVRHVYEIRWAIQAVSRRLPAPPTCLMQALAAKALLGRQQIPATLYLGVAPQATSAALPINAHAWLRCGPHWVTGYQSRQAYQVLVWYG